MYGTSLSSLVLLGDQQESEIFTMYGKHHFRAGRSPASYVPLPNMLERYGHFAVTWRARTEISGAC